MTDISSYAQQGCHDTKELADAYAKWEAMTPKERNIVMKNGQLITLNDLVNEYLDIFRSATPK